MNAPRVYAVAAHPAHDFSKPPQREIRLLEGLGVEGDAHCGATVQHRSHARRDPGKSNLRQVHLIHHELFAELAAQGFTVAPGAIGENVTTESLDLLDLPVGTELTLGPTAVVRLTGLRNPCRLLDQFQPGLMAALLERDAHGDVWRKSGVMGVVIASGTVRPGDPIDVRLPAVPRRRLEPV
ncbi:MOSC domain-containing protein [Acidihalobacter ferrooxydans]|uniref:MOSC domain-containing protein n=1 Tax=Acidihalobacter ferrooxydans TaxID=1765967 RepID=A0A1P8UFT4_9GAMM|nr:MOSC domain-containing protein [Acidihalobacter ferrooxydans]APZ42659.1 MOSC domain-containing protein [Acidihalobacter ferrooxydans]